MSRIRLTIDRLVLNGLERGQEKPLADGLRTELSRLLSDRNGRHALGRSHRTKLLRLGSLPLGRGHAGSRHFGSALAKGIRGGLNP
jgi:hypothetical protein